MTNSSIVNAIVAAIDAAGFRCFGGTRTEGSNWNPITKAMEGKPLHFAAAVDVAEVVRFVLDARTKVDKPRPLAEWHEDMGDVLWWKFPISEAPYVGSPLDLGRDVVVEVSVGAFHGSESKTVTFHIEGWPGYHTHFTPIPETTENPQ